jgi:hypothetical protein
MSSILQARGRAVNIQSAYTNAKAEFILLGNQDESFHTAKIGIPPNPSVAPPDGTAGRTDIERIPDHWMHAPYTVELAKGMGRLAGELGRAHASSQQSLILMEKMLAEEREWIASEKTDASLVKKFKEWNNWWRDQKEIRVKAWLRAREKALGKTGR